MENQQPIKSSKLNNLLKIIGILGIIVVSFSLLFYLVIFPYQKEQRKIIYERRYNHAKNECISEMESKNELFVLKLKNAQSLEFLIDSCAKGKIN